MKKKRLESSQILYYIFLGVVVLEIAAAIFSAALASSPVQRDAALSNIFLGLLAATFFTIPMILEAKFKIPIPKYLKITVLVFIFSAIILGNIRGLLVSVRGYDKVLHIVSGITIAIIGYEIIHYYNLHKNKSVRLSPGLLSVFAFCFSMTLLVLWEIYEFAVDTIAYNLNNDTARNMQRYQWINESIIYPQPYGLMDTMLDLIVGAVGATVVSFVGWRILVRKQLKEGVQGE